jgi:hypothetical protein
VTDGTWPPPGPPWPRRPETPPAPSPWNPDSRTTLLAGLRGQVLDLADAELQAVTKLKELA